MSIARHARGEAGPGWADPDPVAHALVVAGDTATCDELSGALRDARFEVAVAPTAAAALRLVRATDYDLVVLDASVPDAPGIDVLRELRATADVPVILLGAGDSEAERVLALELGADDYLTEPFSRLELASRGRAILRRARGHQPARQLLREVGRLRIDVPRHEVTVGGRPVEITASEFRVLALLAGSPGKVFTRRQIMEEVWGGPYFGDGHPVDTHVLNLRRKIETDATRPRRLLTVRGVGFKLVAPVCEALD